MFFERALAAVPQELFQKRDIPQRGGGAFDRLAGGANALGESVAKAQRWVMTARAGNVAIARQQWIEKQIGFWKSVEPRIEQRPAGKPYRLSLKTRDGNPDAPQAQLLLMGGGWKAF